MNVVKLRGAEIIDKFMRNIFEKNYSGFEAENAFLGNGPKIDDLLLKENTDPSKLSRTELREKIIQFYPLRPEMPEKKWGRDLYNLIAEELKLDPENPTGLAFYNCLGTNLDRRGVDCFFVFKNFQTRRKAYFDIDITTNDKKDRWKSDLVINVNDFPDHHKDEQMYLSELKSYAKMIAEKLLFDTQTIH